jgi:hypothetical protein
MADYMDPAYALSEIQEKAKVGFLSFRREALDGAAELDLDRHDIVACILALTSADFHKSMDAERLIWKGCRQDVYKTIYCGYDLYVKMQYWPQKRLFVVSFKRK